MNVVVEFQKYYDISALFCMLCNELCSNKERDWLCDNFKDAVGVIMSAMNSF